ncbi:hypothetical protein XM38_012190 [Halomicronema hongdechloris C2206]|uniref:Homeodomain phBC6A51-type domain-containing protein n=1 Tax=Halomicronema hongdechloris C2206 TaxID=1641165 RepID=A0A1Z3HIZ0_9CYAN|nr:hypothetical protein [Halomicronema hongdechloris]ASC70282.1 hypothetical protein XM38_012190 [Halomicronema hongdechloris C2206]
MAQNGDNLTPKQLAAVAELARGSSHQATVDATGVSHRQLSRWKAQPDFKEAILEAQRAIYGQSIAAIVTAMNTATTTLVEICENQEASDASRVSAARSILENGLKAFGQADLDRRVEEIEELFKSESAETT